MCGIAGIYGRGASTSDLEASLRKMWPGIASRGPDGRGSLLAPELALLHSRLAIIDLPTGDQPIWNETRTVACVFNGEIYNYRSLRESLKQSGHSLATTSDTEVLVHLYEDHGPDLFDRIHGMFAFAIYDATRRRLLVGRDRLGIKPLYIAKTPNGLAFASSIASLVALDISKDPDYGAIAEYLRFYKIAEPRTAYSAVRTVLPGHLVTLDLETGAHSTRRYHRVGPKRTGNAAQASSEARAAFERAVASHLVADVEVGAFLSGGIDSTLVVAQAQRLSSRPIQTFSIGFADEPAFSETKFAEQVSKALGTRHHTIELSSPPSEIVKEAMVAAGQPFAVASFLPALVLSRMAARSVKVVLTGDGGDEVGVGYPWYRWMRVARKRLGWLGGLESFAGALEGLERYSSLDQRLRLLRRGAKFGKGALLRGAAAADAWRYDLAASDAPALLAAEHRESARASLGPSPYSLEWDDDSSDLEALRFADLRVLLRDEMLPKLDRAGMAHGLEGRVPLLDDDFVAAMLAVPIEEHLGHPQGKALLRAWAKELCPDVDAVRPKHGFDVPIRRWLEHELRPDVDRCLLSGRGGALFDTAGVKATWARMRAGVPGAGHTIYAMLIGELWFEGQTKPEMRTDMPEPIGARP